MKHINITNFEGSITDWTKLNYIAGGMEDDVASLANQTGNKLSKDENGDWQIKDSNGDVIWPTPPGPTIDKVFYAKTTGSTTTAYVINNYTIETDANPDIAYGGSVWSDGSDTFFDVNNQHLMYDKTNKTWITNPYSDFATVNVLSGHIWSDCNNHIYFKNTHIYDKTNHTWTAINMSIPFTWAQVNTYLYKYNNNVYRINYNISTSAIESSYIFNPVNLTWTLDSTAPNAPDGQSGQADSYWTDGTDLYFKGYLYDGNNWVNKSMITGLGGSKIFKYNNELYFYKSNAFYKWNSQTKQFIETSDFTNIVALKYPNEMYSVSEGNVSALTTANKAI